MPKTKTRITTMSWPRCPDSRCKGELEAVETHEGMFKPFRCEQCEKSFELQDVLGGWIKGSYLKESFVKKVWNVALTEINRNHEDVVRDLQKRLKKAKECKHFYVTEDGNWGCKDPNRVPFHENETMHCYLAGNAHASCHEPLKSLKKIKDKKMEEVEG